MELKTEKKKKFKTDNRKNKPGEYESRVLLLLKTRRGDKRERAQNGEGNGFKMGSRQGLGLYIFSLFNFEEKQIKVEETDTKGILLLRWAPPTLTNLVHLLCKSYSHIPHEPPTKPKAIFLCIPNAHSSSCA